MISLFTHDNAHWHYTLTQYTDITHWHYCSYVTVWAACQSHCQTCHIQYGFSFVSFWWFWSQMFGFIIRVVSNIVEWLSKCQTPNNGALNDKSHQANNLSMDSYCMSMVIGLHIIVHPSKIDCIPQQHCIGFPSLILPCCSLAVFSIVSTNSQFSLSIDSKSLYIYQYLAIFW